MLKPGPERRPSPSNQDPAIVAAIATVTAAAAAAAAAVAANPPPTTQRTSPRQLSMFSWFLGNPTATPAAPSAFAARAFTSAAVAAPAAAAAAAADGARRHSSFVSQPIVSAGSVATMTGVGAASGSKGVRKYEIQPLGEDPGVVGQGNLGLLLTNFESQLMVQSLVQQFERAQKYVELNREGLAAEQVQVLQVSLNFFVFFIKGPS